MDSGSADALEQLMDYLFRRVDGFDRGLLSRTKPVALHDSVLILAVPDDYTREQIESRVRPSIETLLLERFDKTMSIALTVDNSLQLDPEPIEVDEPLQPELPVAGNGFQAPKIPLNPRYTFDNFVVGESNRLAHATALAVAENPGQTFNPLFIYGSTGLGKTHLLQAIGHYLQSYYPHLRVKYASTENMLNEFVNSMGPLYERRQADFRRRYREEVDVLLIDDIQFLENKKETQIEFFNTFVDLEREQKQIVLTSDRPPQALTELEPRLRSRFGGGVMADVQFPSLETRVAILRSKVLSNNLEVSSGVLEFIATRVQSSVRELEGSLLTVTSYASLTKKPLDLALTEQVLKDTLPVDLQVVITPDLIQNQVADYYQLSVDALVGQGRTQSIVLARQVAMYLCRELTNLSLPKIGQSFGARDHTTVMYADRKIKGLLRERRDLFDQVTDLTTRIRTAAR